MIGSSWPGRLILTVLPKIAMCDGSRIATMFWSSVDSPTNTFHEWCCRSCSTQKSAPPSTRCPTLHSNHVRCAVTAQTGVLMLVPSIATDMSQKKLTGYLISNFHRVCVQTACAVPNWKNWTLDKIKCIFMSVIVSGVQQASGSAEVPATRRNAPCSSSSSAACRRGCHQPRRWSRGRGRSACLCCRTGGCRLGRLS